MRSRLHRLILWSAYLLTFTVLALLAWRGWSYYTTPLLERPRHPDYWMLKPGGSLGHTLGMIGAGLMVLMQVYTIRKRVRRLRQVGKLSAWLDFHIYCGVVGPLLIVLHSSLKVGGLVSVSFWSMVVVVLSGVLGRFLYLQIPRRRSGDQLTLDEVGAVAADQAHELRERFGLSASQLEQLDRLAVETIELDSSLWMLAVRLPVDRIRLKVRIAGFLRGLEGVPERSLAGLKRLTTARAELQRRLVMLAKLQELFHYWHVLHKPFAVIMYIFMVVHIGVAVATGYGWSP